MTVILIAAGAAALYNAAYAVYSFGRGAVKAGAGACFMALLAFASASLCAAYIS